jgi:hypothetical protein
VVFVVGDLGAELFGAELGAVEVGGFFAEFAVVVGWWG